MFYSADGLLHIYSTSSLLAKACGCPLELLRRPSWPVGWFRHSCLYLCQHWYWGQRGAHWIQFKPQKILWFWRPMCVPPQCQHDIEKTGVWSLLLAWWRMKRVTCFAVWRMELYDSMLDVRLGYASICKRVAGHTHWRSFFGAAAFLVVLDRLCFFWWKPFLASISGRPLLLFH